ncbi:MAG: AmmeMemoRadiSam system radical SAM enzyme [Planctomycetaceae bacterium]|nr:AmmeMemoRadiSam system radical SAM enzyme [Planctomycetaceae bacterium]
MPLVCRRCPNYCSIAENETGNTGICRFRTVRSGKVVPARSNCCTGLAVDPIEKKPLNHFFPASKVLSFGLIGCNFFCKFCQNWSTAQSGDLRLLSCEVSPEFIVQKAKELNCKSIAFTYNEPIIWAEYAVETAKIAQQAGVKSVAVSNGYISDEDRSWFFGAMDAANIDIKSFSNDFYKTYCGGKLQPVLDTVKYLADNPKVHLEITTLLIPALNDSDAEIDALSKWLVRNTGYETPLHFSAFYPANRLKDVPPTPPSTLFRAREIARNNGLKYVYTGNIDDAAGQTTYCPQCNQAVVVRCRYRIDEYHIDEESCCKFCGQSISGAGLLYF